MQRRVALHYKLSTGSLPSRRNAYWTSPGTLAVNRFCGQEWSEQDGKPLFMGRPRGCTVGRRDMPDERIASVGAALSTGPDNGDLARYASPERLRHIVLDFLQMKSFVDKPLVMARAEGVWYWDIHGKRYLDGISGI